MAFNLQAAAGRLLAEVWHKHKDGYGNDQQLVY
jgi:hypothetical protein